MPVQKHDTRPAERPSGLVPPPVSLHGVTELRLHGVGGTSPENLLADVAPQLVAGNRIAGFFRTADVKNRHVEAYSWGGLTSRSASRVLWLLLFPFALANLAGWMCTTRAWRTGWRFYLHRAVVRWAALGMTINLLLLTAMTTMDLVGYQCGAQPGCVDHWWLRWIRIGRLAEHAGWRVLVGAAVPLLVLLGLVILAGRSLSRYEQVAPPRRVGDLADETRTPTPARPNVGLDDRDFWNGERTVADLALLHVGAGLAFLGWIVAYTVRAIPVEAGVPLRWAGLDVAATVSALLALAATAMLLTLDATPRGLTRSVVVFGLLAVACAVLLALAQPPSAAPYGPPGSLPGMRMAANWTYGFCIGAALAVLLSFAVCGHHKGTFFTAGPFVAVTVGVVMLNGIGIGTMIRVADLLGNVPNPGAGTARPNPLYVFDMIYAVTPYLTLLPIAILVCFVIVEGLTVWYAGRPSRRAEIRAEYARMPAPDPQTLWDHSALQEDERRRAVAARVARAGWAARVARGRRLAWMARDVDKLLTVLACTALAVLAYSWVRFLAYDALPYTPRWMLTASTWLAAAMPLAVLVLIRQGWRGLDNRRHIGVVWDVGTFWPRAYHPFAPPSYSERAVPELQRRLWHLHDNSGRVVIAAHSQGSVIATAALLQESSRPGDDEVGLVTFGSPLAKLYGWAFPAYFGDRVLTSGRPRVWRWHNFFYDTDYIGGRVFPEDGPNTADRRIDDPPTAWYVYGQEPPSLGRHSGYWIDPQVWAVVDEYAMDLPVRIGPPAPGTTLAPEPGAAGNRAAPDA